MKKKFYNCPSVEVTMVSSYGLCQPESVTMEPGGPIYSDPDSEGL